MAGPGSRSHLRIVAGELGGRRLTSPDRDAFRPSTERTREAIFSMLGPLDGLSALDLFCGSGALGLEALSRGAGHLTLVDSEIALATENVARLGVGERCELFGADAVEFLVRAQRRFDLVLCDPPYRLAARLGPKLDKPLADRLTPGGRVVVESPRDSPLQLALPLLRERRYGRSLVRIHGSAVS
jgi:16S rRNA (guanine966-N2)-methyltransferase